MKRPKSINDIFIIIPDKMVDKAKLYSTNLSEVEKYVKMLERELEGKNELIEKLGDAIKNYRALQKIQTIIQETLGNISPIG